MVRRVACLMGLALVGCYHVGVKPIDGGDTVAVPMFQNRTLRRELEHALTRHVRREVLETTPLHLAAEEDAALVVRGAVHDVRETALIVGPALEAQHAAVSVTVRFAVFDRGGTMVSGEDPDAEHSRVGYAEFTASRGETREAALDEALRDIAEMVVHELTAREDDRHEPNDVAEQAVTVAPGRQIALRQRDADWFEVEVPAGLGLTVTLLAPEGPFGLELRSAKGAPLDDATLAADRRDARLAPGPASRSVLIVVTGDDAGRTYQLLLRLSPLG
jgi:hypothetical protein